MNAQEYNQSIQDLPTLGCISWKYNNKWIYIDIIEIEAEFPDTNEHFVRYRALHMKPLVKVKNGLIYFLTERASNGELNWPEFETRGIKCNINIF